MDRNREQLLDILFDWTAVDLERLARLGEGEERWMLETQSVRDRNRVSDTLAEALAIIDDALARLG